MVVRPRQCATASTMPKASVSMSLAQKANGHGVLGDATNPKYITGMLHVAGRVTVNEQSSS